MKSSLVFLTCAVVLCSPLNLPENECDLFARAVRATINGRASGNVYLAKEVKLYQRCQTAVRDVARKCGSDLECAKKGYAKVRAENTAAYLALYSQVPVFKNGYLVGA